jgi:hypothetical protein
MIPAMDAESSAKAPGLPPQGAAVEAGAAFAPRRGVRHTGSPGGRGVSPGTALRPEACVPSLPVQGDYCTMLRAKAAIISPVRIGNVIKPSGG